jgi:hypothetical protein
MDEDTNAPDPTHLNRELGSNETDMSDTHDKKHDGPTILTLRGITID